MDITPETVKNIKSRGFVKCAITPNVYVINGKLGCSWYLHQAQYWEPEGDNGYVDKSNFVFYLLMTRMKMKIIRRTKIKL